MGVYFSEVSPPLGTLRRPFNVVKLCGTLSRQNSIPLPFQTVPMKTVCQSLSRFVLLSAAVLFGAVLSGASLRGQSTAAVDVATPKFAATDWPWWRGPRRDGSAAPDQDPPKHWDAETNIMWRAPVAGRGHGSPMLLGDHVYLATADHQREAQLVLCFDRKTGAQVWESVVHQGGFTNESSRKMNEKASLASSTVATDGEQLFINFLNDNAVFTTALGLDGSVLWQQRLCDYVLHQGYGASPAIYEDLVIASADNKGGGAVVAMKRETGEVVWRRSRPEKPNYASPSIVTIGGRDQLIFTGCDLVTSLDPRTGKELWEIEGATTECVTTTVTDGKHVFSSGGYPKNHVAAIVADGSGTIAWEVNLRDYVPSMVYRDGHLFMTLDAGIAVCVESSTGETVWKERLGGTFSSSPVLVGDLIYATNEEGETFIFRANTEEFVGIAANQLGESVYATPVIAGDRIYTRVARFEDGKRQEYLFCIGE